MYPGTHITGGDGMFIVNVEGAVYHENKWLIIERSAKESHAGGTLSLVGGKVDTDDGGADVLEKNVRREIFEEVGIEIKKSVHYVYSSSFISDDGDPVVNVVFLCGYESGTAYINSPDEVDAVYWMTAEEGFSHPKTPPWTKESIKRADELRRNLQHLNQG